MTGLAVTLGSFAFQLLGHRLHEDLVAPPRLFHGLVAAWPLEMTAFWLRLGAPVADSIDKDQLLGHVDDIRAQVLGITLITATEKNVQYREL